MSAADDLIQVCAENLHAGCPECGGQGGTYQPTGVPGADEPMACMSLELLRQTVVDVFTTAWARDWRLVRFADGYRGHPVPMLDPDGDPVLADEWTPEALR